MFISRPDAPSSLLTAVYRSPISMWSIGTTAVSWAKSRSWCTS
jgi:hypothetical protein